MQPRAAWIVSLWLAVVVATPPAQSGQAVPVALPTRRSKRGSMRWPPSCAAWSARTSRWPIRMPSWPST
jgi:hypothetical protein